MISILDNDQIINLKESGRILSLAMEKVKKSVRPGIKTKELDITAEKCIRDNGAVPAFKNYEIEGIGRYPASLCVSVNHQVVHGIPGEYILKEGDIVSLDLGAGYKGIYSDMAITLPVGKISGDAKKLIDITQQCLLAGINEAKIGNKIGAIGEAIQNLAEKNSLGVVRDLVGHGIGIKPHMSPQVPNFGNKNQGEDIVEGLAIAIEPMITFGHYAVKLESDNWTISTSDKSLSAHFEHTIVIENGVPTVITKI